MINFAQFPLDIQAKILFHVDDFATTSLVSKGFRATAEHSLGQR